MSFIDILSIPLGDMFHKLRKVLVVVNRFEEEMNMIGHQYETIYLTGIFLFS